MRDSFIFKILLYPLKDDSVKKQHFRGQMNSRPARKQFLFCPNLTKTTARNELQIQLPSANLNLNYEIIKGRNQATNWVPLTKKTEVEHLLQVYI
jgi:hypothetical protein